jgi:hypothetical protein
VRRGIPRAIQIGKIGRFLKLEIELAEKQASFPNQIAGTVGNHGDF